MQPEVIVALGVFSVPAVALVVLFQIRRLQSEERKLAIEKGVPIPFEPLDPWERAFRTRRAGIVILAVGLGLALAFAILAWAQQDRHILAVCGFALVPTLIGLGLLYDYKLRVQHLEAAQIGKGGV